jgi:hypothetical protein
MQVVVDFEEMSRDDRAQQNSAEARRWICRQHQMTEGNTPRWRDGP